MQVDKHVCKMPLECSQMLSDTMHFFGANAPMSICNINHPCTIWARQSKENINWLVQLMLELNKEWIYRYDHPEGRLNAGVNKVLKSEFLEVYEHFEYPQSGLTPFAQAMNDEYKCSDTSDLQNIVDAYTRFYLHEKSHLFSYTKRFAPEFIPRFQYRESRKHSYEEYYWEESEVLIA